MTPHRTSLLERLGLGRPELRAWAMYDWANSAFVCTVVTAVFPIYFRRVAADGMTRERADAWFMFATTAAMAVSAVISPYLGALADASGRVKRMLGVSLAFGLASTLSLFFVRSGDWVLGAALFGAGNIAASASFVFYDGMLPRIARPDEVDRVSTAGYALGYVGGGVLLALNLAWIANPALVGLPSGEGLTPDEATLPARLAFVSVAVWWLAFSIPLFRRVPDPRPVAADHAARGSRLLAAFRQLVATYRGIRRYPQAWLMLLAFLCFNDGIGTIFRVGAIFGDEHQVPQSHVMFAIVLVQFAGIPFAFAFGWLAGRIGPKRAILAGIAIYLGITALAYFMSNETHFFALAFLVAVAQGGTQALSRSLFSTLVPAERAAEFFGFFGVVEKFAGLAGPALFGTVRLVTGSLSASVLSILPFFLVGGWLLLRVDVERGRAAAVA